MRVIERKLDRCTEYWDEIDIFIDSTIAWSEHRQALVLAVDRHQFDRALRDLVARARAGERFETTGDEE